MVRPGDLMSLKEAAALFPGKNARWVRERLCGAGRVDYVQVLGERYVVRKSLEAFLERNLHAAHKCMLLERARETRGGDWRAAK